MSNCRSQINFDTISCMVVGSKEIRYLEKGNVRKQSVVLYKIRTNILIQFVDITTHANGITEHGTVKERRRNGNVFFYCVKMQSETHINHYMCVNQIISRKSDMLNPRAKGNLLDSTIDEALQTSLPTTFCTIFFRDET